MSHIGWFCPRMLPPIANRVLNNCDALQLGRTKPLTVANLQDHSIRFGHSQLRLLEMISWQPFDGESQTTGVRQAACNVSPVLAPWVRLRGVNPYRRGVCLESGNA